MSEPFDVVGIGCCASDTLCVFEGDIEVDTKMQVHDLTQQGGGLVATGLVAVARLGGKGRYIGKIGDDSMSQFVRQEFIREGVDVSALRTAPGQSVITSFIAASPKTGARTIFYSLDRVPVLTADDLNKDEVLSGRVLYVDGFQVKGAIHAARWARKAGRRVVMDAEMTAPENDDLMDLCTHVVASHAFARTRVGDVPPEEAAAKLYHRLVKKDPDKVVGVTAGINGSYFVSAEGTFHQPAFRVPVVDTTGCGDVFHGAFVYGLVQDWPLPRIAEFASAVAALKTRKLGGRAGIPNRRETEEFIRSHKR
jgi:sugar/nucleoside kinase (ribokinase family)